MFDRQIDDLCVQMGISARESHFPDQISGGEKQRCAIARALVNSPKLLLADEPTGNLDSDTSSGIIVLLLDMNKSGTTIMLATHDMGIRDKILSSAARAMLAVLKDGELTIEK